MRLTPGGANESVESKSVANLLGLIDIVRDDAKYRAMLDDLLSKMQALEDERAEVKRLADAQKAASDAAAAAAASREQALDKRDADLKDGQTRLMEQQAFAAARQTQLEAAIAQTQKMAEDTKAKLDARSDNLDTREVDLRGALKQLDADTRATAKLQASLDAREATVAAAEALVAKRRASIDAVLQAIDA